MKRSIPLTLLMTLALAALGPAGCVRKAKNPTPIPSVSRTIGTQGQGTFDSVPTLPPDQPSTGGGVRSGDVPPGGFRDPGTATTPAIEGNIPESTGDFANAKEDREFFRANTVYFDFDRSTIRSGERKKIEAVADYLKTKAAEWVKIEGHCDERGTEGYNLSLGQRRAQAIREYLVKVGVAADKVVTISYGEDRPAVDGHSEAAWSKNRRGDFVLLKP